MKAAAQDQWKLLDLAQTDRRIAQAEHRRRTLPELAELKDLAVQRRTLAEEVVAKSTALSVFWLRSIRARPRTSSRPNGAQPENRGCGHHHRP